MCYEDYRLYFVGGSYSSVYVPPPLFVFPIVLLICILMDFLSFPLIFIFWYTYFLVNIMPGLLFPNCVQFNHDWMKTFGGVCICISSYAAICAFWNMCTWYKLAYMISLARIVKISMWYIDNVCVLAYHSICIFFCMCQWPHSLPCLHLAILHVYLFLIHNLPFIIFAYQLMPITLGWYKLWKEHAWILKDCPGYNQIKFCKGIVTCLLKETCTVTSIKLCRPLC